MLLRLMPRPLANLALLAALSGAVSPGAVVAQQRILPFGDSITECTTGWASYRYFLWKQLGVIRACSDFVGNRHGVAGGAPLFQDFDQDHSGFSSCSATWIDVMIQLRMLRVPAADVALIHLGTNDILLPLFAGIQPNLDVAREAVADIIRALREENPAVKIAIAQILPIGPMASAPMANLFVPIWNQVQLPRLLALSSRTSPIALVDMNTGFDPSVHFRDSVHPNDLGNHMMAKRWALALEDLHWLQGGVPCISHLAPACGQPGVGPATMTAASPAVPTPGGSLVFRLSTLPGTTVAGALALGLTEATPTVDWGGCPVYATPDVVMLVLRSPGALEMDFTLSLPAWVPPGLVLYAQGLTWGDGVSDDSASNGLQLFVY